MCDAIVRCNWADLGERSLRYHDNEWGRPCHDERKLFKMLILEGMQAGLSWSVILNKMEALCEAFDDFAPRTVASYDEARIEELLRDRRIIRNRLKVNAAVHNARAYLKLIEARNSLDSYLWDFVDGRPIINEWTKLRQIPSETPLSGIISADLRRRGFKFAGSTIIHAFMQAVGLINDHLLSCGFRGV
jgi:DNA-3-methyladenine glycosylase I